MNLFKITNFTVCFQLRKCAEFFSICIFLSKYKAYGIFEIAF